MTKAFGKRRRAIETAESEPAWLAPERQKVDLQLWVRLLACAHAAEQRVKNRIKENFGINQTQFNLLSQLDRAPEGIRMGEVARRTVVTGSNVTAVVDDLERRGLVLRQTAEGDRRATVITLHRSGRRRSRRWRRSMPTGSRRFSRRCRSRRSGNWSAISTG